MRFPRMTMRRWMVIVAVMAIILGFIAWDIRLQAIARVYRSRAWKMGRIEETNRLAESYLSKQSESDRLLTGAIEQAMADFKSAGARKRELEREAESLREHALKVRAEAIQKRKITAHYGSLRKRYEEAARHPWREVAPDPPEPK